MTDAKFIGEYLELIDRRWPAKAETIKFERAIKERPRIDPEDHKKLMARLAVFDDKIKRKRRDKSVDIESDHVDWQAIENKVVERKKDFSVPLMVDGSEVSFVVTAFNMTYARQLAIQAAKEAGAANVVLIN
jgi:hypothetical protein